MRRLAVLLAILGGCGTPDDAEPDDALSFAADIEPLLGTCAGCHRGEAPDGALDLSGDLYAALVDQPSGQSDLSLVEPFDSRYSYVWHKLNGTQSLAGGAGTRMPLGDPLSDSEIALVGSWIDEGARP